GGARRVAADDERLHRVVEGQLARVDRDVDGADEDVLDLGVVDARSPRARARRRRLVSHHRLAVRGVVAPARSALRQGTFAMTSTSADKPAAAGNSINVIDVWKTYRGAKDPTLKGV